MRIFVVIFLAACVAARATVSIEIDLSAQKAWLLQDGQRVYDTPISSGRAAYPTVAGEFVVTEKDLDHRSSLYGRIVDGEGRTLVSDADSDMALPSGAKFVQAPMKYFLRFDGATGMHAGHLPGYPASHGCVRLPPARAALFFNVADIGTPVRVFGSVPYRKRPPQQTSPAVPAPPAAATPPPKRWFPWLRRSAR